MCEKPKVIGREYNFSVVSHSLLAIFVLTVAPALLPAQPPVSEKTAWIAKNAVAIRSIDPKDDDFADLLPLKQFIGSARFVLLGGPNDISRNVASAYAKYRLVRFLHEEMDFDVIASGIPFFDAEETDRALDGKTAIRNDLGQESDSVFSYLAHGTTGFPAERITAGNTINGNAKYAGAPIELPGTSPSHTNDILSYARATRNTDRPLHIAGFGQTVVGGPLSDYAKQLFRFIDRVDPALVLPADRAAIVKMVAWQSLTSSKQWSKTARPGLAAIERLSERLARLPEDGANAHELSLYRLTLAYLASWAGPKAGRTDVRPPTHPLYWYAKNWRPDSKIIVWSDNARIARDLPPEHDTYGRPPPAPIGVDAIAHALGATDYSIAFTEIGNEAATLQVLVAGPQPSLSPFSGSFESLMHAAHIPFSFIDFRTLPPDHWLRRPLNARFLTTRGGGIEISTWPTNFDAAITIDLTNLKSGHPAGLPR
jgi:erythromycin esterase-like protein